MRIGRTRLPGQMKSEFVDLCYNLFRRWYQIVSDWQVNAL